MGKSRTRRELKTPAFVISALAITGLLLLCLLSAAAEEAMQLEIIELGNTTVDNILPMLEPLAAPGATLTGQGSQLIVKTTARNLDEIKQVLSHLDKAPKTLRISVRQDLYGHFTHRDDAISARGQSGDFGVSVDNRRYGAAGAGIGYRDENGNTVRYQTTNTRSTDDERNTHFITTLEGRPALIFTGESTPYGSRSAYFGPYGGGYHEDVYFEDTNRGFYVTPRLSGERVTLEIAPQLDRIVDRRSGAIDRRAAATTVTARLGEWVPLGGANQSGSSNQSEILARTRGAQDESYSVWVKVELVN